MIPAEILTTASTDRDRFPDSNYQLQVLLRDLLAERAASGDRRAMEAVVKISAGIMELRGEPPLKSPRGGPKAATRMKLFESANRQYQVSLPQYLDELAKIRERHRA
jgi:hypothetical protein